MRSPRARGVGVEICYGGIFGPGFGVIPRRLRCMRAPGYGTGLSGWMVLLAAVVGLFRWLLGLV